MRTKQEYQDALDNIGEGRSYDSVFNSKNKGYYSKEIELLKELIDNLKENEDEKINR